MELQIFETAVYSNLQIRSARELTWLMYMLFGWYVPAIGLDPVTVQVRSSLNTAAKDAPKLSSATAENILSTKVRVSFVIVKPDMISGEMDGHGWHGFQVGEQDAFVMMVLHATASVKKLICILFDGAAMNRRQTRLCSLCRLKRRFARISMLFCIVLSA